MSELSQTSSQQPYSPLSSEGESGSGPEPDSPNTSPPVLTRTHTIPLKRKAGRKKFKETRHPIYHGVRQRDSGKWVCEVREPNKKTRIWVGTYPNPELAARAYDVAALALRGNLTALNYPDSAWLTPRAKSNSASDIRLAALQATRMDLISSSLASSSHNGGESDQQNKEDSKSSEMECMKKKDLEDSKSSEMECMKKKDLEDSRRMFLDEEAIFNMPCLINSMAEGMLLTPPALKRGIGWDDIYNEGDNSFLELDLWR